MTLGKTPKLQAQKNHPKVVPLLYTLSFGRSAKMPRETVKKRYYPTHTKQYNRILARCPISASPTHSVESVKVSQTTGPIAPAGLKWDAEREAIGLLPNLMYVKLSLGTAHPQGRERRVVMTLSPSHAKERHLRKAMNSVRRLSFLSDVLIRTGNMCSESSNPVEL